jgi:two-component system, NarL family, nitrate/nitrite response regulator NarL
MPSTIHVSILSDSRILRDAISFRLISEDGIELLRAVGAVRDLLQSGLFDEPEVVLIHSTSAPADMAQTTWELKRLLPSVRVVVAGCRSGESDAVRAIEAGASACLEDGAATFRDLVDAVKAAAEGRATGFSVEILVEIGRRIKSLSETRESSPAQASPELSPNEAEVVRLIAVGLSNKQIALRLGTKLSTAKNHVHNALHKMNVKRRRDLIGAT